MTNETKEGEVLTAEEMVNELTKTRRVDAVESGRPFFTVNKDLNVEIAGHTKLIDFDNGAAKGLVFIAPDGKQYSLGNPSRKQTHHTIINHHQVVQPIAEAGFDLVSVTHNRGGVGMCGIFEHPDISINDPISWDEETRSRKEGGQLNLSIAAFLDARTGKSIRLAAGYLRVICTNGLTASILGMGSLRITHNGFSKPKIDQFAQNVIGEASNAEFETFSPKVLEYPMAMLDQYQREPEATLAAMPSFVAKPFRTALASMPNWAADEMLYQMNLACESRQDLSALDILNIVTNTNNAGENDQLLFRLESISEAFMSLLEVSAFRMNIDFPATYANTR